MTRDRRARREERRRSNLTGRAAVLALVVCLLAISLAYPLREYLAQRGDISDVPRPGRRAGGSGSPSCARQHERWEDPAYVEAQARERLHYVMPGETSYVVLEADEAPAQDGVVEAQAPGSRAQPVVHRPVEQRRGRGRRPEVPQVTDRPDPAGPRAPSTAAARPGRRAACAGWRTAARAATPTSSRPRRGCPTARRSRRSTT